MLIDLSKSIYDRMPKASALPAVEVTEIMNHEPNDSTASKGYTNRLLSLKMTEHISTHIDAPVHFNRKGKSIDELPLEDFYLIDTVVLDLTEKKEFDAIEVADLQRAEKVAAEVKSGDLVILNTGFDAYWGTEKYLKHPFLSLPAAEYLIGRGIRVLGVDTLSIDDVRRPERPIHLAFLKENSIPVIESIGNLQEIPSPRFKSIFFPLKIKGGSGSPIRLIGVFD